MKFLKRIFKTRPSYPESMFVGEIGALQEELSDLALRIADEFYSVELDFTHDSITQVEKILADLHRQYKQTGKSEGLSGIAAEFGSYIGATIQKNTGSGHFEKDHPSLGEGAFPFYWMEATIFPFSWCEKRIFDGSADDISTKYEVFVLEKI